MKGIPEQRSRHTPEMNSMQATNRRLEKRYVRSLTAAAAFACVLLAGASAKPCLAGPPIETVFPSPDEASRALTSAVEEHDERAVAKILGGTNNLIHSDDSAQDGLDRERFVQKYREMHRWVGESGGIAILYIGAENWPFPIPLVSHNGKWRFEPKAGSDEILFRRIGENEVAAILVCDTLVATRVRPAADREASPLHGYHFRILPSSNGGVAVIAYPAAYRSSGVMTFSVMQDGAVTEKDLGPNTARIAGAMTSHDTDATWTPVETTR